MVIGHPGSWQQFQFRPDNKGLNVMEMKSKYLHEQYLFEAQILNQIHQQNMFMNGAGGGGPLPSSEPTPILEVGAKIVFIANSILDINTDLGWNVNNIEDWKTYAFDTISGEITYLTVTETFPQTFEVIIGGLTGLEVEVKTNAFINTTTLSSIGRTDNIEVDGIIVSMGQQSFRGSSISIFTSEICQQVGDASFKDSSLLQVTLGNGTSNIDLPASLFEGCINLETINLNFIEITIQTSVFKACSSIPNITFGDKIISIDARAFEDCTSLSSITLGTPYLGDDGTFNGVIGAFAFSGCTNLNSFTLYNSNTNSLNQNIDNLAFADCSTLSNIYIHNLLVLNGTNIFQGLPSPGDATFKTDQDNLTYDPNDEIDTLTGWNITYN